jgi:prolyl-tRNA synthetase
VLYDDRDAGPGEKLTDAELLGCPLRIVAGRRGLAAGVVEASERDGGKEHELPVGSAAEEALAILRGDV